jgi:glutamate transport system substrate-binding protein
MRARIGIAAAAASTVVLAAAGCGGQAQASILERAQGEQHLVIGVKYDQPALGLKGRGGVEGFDVDVARYVARKLGGPDVEIEFREARSADRENMLVQGKVDLILATYSITPERKRKVAFAGPYYVAHQDTMVRAGETGVGQVDDLEGRRLCKTAGSNSWRRVTEEKSIKAKLVPAATYSDCFDMLKSRRVDAMSTDDLILAGFALRDPRAVRLVNVPFTDEKYGVGMHKGDIEGCEAINKALTEMYQDGTARRLLQKWFGPTDLKVTTSVPQFEGCEQ